MIVNKTVILYVEESGPLPEISGYSEATLLRHEVQTLGFV